MFYKNLLNSTKVAFLFLLVLGVSRGTQADQLDDGFTSFDFTYDDIAHQNYHRWVYTEKEQEGITLFLVIDEQLNSQAKPNVVRQETVTRQLFSSPENLKLAVTKYTDPNQAKYTEHKLKAVRGDALPLWVATNSWSTGAEADYSNWVATTDLQTYFSDIDIDFDCADFAILTRWVYARDHQLPAANSLAGNGQLFGNFSGNAAWDKLPQSSDWKKDERFKAAIRYVLDSTFTHSIVADLYPVGVNRTWVTPGSILLVLYDQLSGHTQVIKAVGLDPICHGEECVTVNYGNEPASTEVYHEFAWYGWGENHGPSHNDGFLRWRWPTLTAQGWQLTTAAAMPGYSTMQYQAPDDIDFQYWVSDQLNLHLTESNAAIQQVDEFERIATKRFSLVATGSLFCHYQICAVDSINYNNYSTFSRDARLREAAQRFLQHSNAAPNDAAITRELQYFEDNDGDFYKQFFGMTFTQVLLNQNGILDHLNADPRVSIAERWGFQPTAVAAEQSFAILADSLSFSYADREVIVEHGSDACNGHCDPSGQVYQQYETSARDLGLQLALKEILALPVNQMADQLNIKLSGEFSDEVDSNSCGTNRQCTEWDMIFGHPDWFSKMSGDPNDPLDKRYGVQH